MFGGIDKVALELHLMWVDGRYQQRRRDAIERRFEGMWLCQVANDGFYLWAGHQGGLFRVADQRPHWYAPTA
jgi:hypothetical protein